VFAGTRQPHGGLFMERVFVSINEACEALGLGKTSIYQLIKAGKLDVVKFGRRTLITAQSVRALAQPAG
jgi:excisionase family DNA binding protein